MCERDNCRDQDSSLDSGGDGGQALMEITGSLSGEDSRLDRLNEIMNGGVVKPMKERALKYYKETCDQEDRTGQGAAGRNLRAAAARNRLGLTEPVAANAHVEAGSPREDWRQQERRRQKGQPKEERQEK